MAVSSITQKTCSTCRAVKTPAEFYSNRSKVDGLSNQCRPCTKASNFKAASKPESIEAKREYNREYKLRNPAPPMPTEVSYAYRLRAFYGMSMADYDLMYEAQQGRCAICDKQQPKRKLVVDHDHTTQVVRGLLCRACNSALGVLGDTLDGLMRAVRYLKP